MDDRLVDNKLFMVTAISDWPADIVEFFTTPKIVIY